MLSVSRREYAPEHMKHGRLRCERYHDVSAGSWQPLQSRRSRYTDHACSYMGDRGAAVTEQSSCRSASGRVPLVYSVDGKQLHIW